MASRPKNSRGQNDQAVHQVARPSALLTWAIAGGLLVLGILSMPSVGIFVLGAMFAICSFLLRSGRSSESLALPIGAGLVLVAVGLLQLTKRDCPDNGSRALPPGEWVFDCDSRLPVVPLLAGGGALLAVGFLLLLPLRKPTDSQPR
jgi:hypothetical protein